VAEDAVGSDPGRLLSEAVAGGLLITEGVVGCSVTEIGSDAGTGADRYRTPVYAGEAVTAVLTRSASPAQQAVIEGAAAELRAAAGARALLAQARAVIAGTDDVSDTEAFTRLAQRSGREGRSILAVARDVLASAGRPVGQEPPA
jgi:hypothetical protein